MTAVDTVEAVGATRRWIERFVIGQALCPFAAVPFRQERIAYFVCEGESLDEIHKDFLQALRELVLADPDRQETALLILSRGLVAFDEYLEGLAAVEQAVRDVGLEGVIQVASFHPDYRFRGTSPDDPANYSNRSPFPMFHLIREERLAEALTSHSDPEGIPERNVRRLRELGTQRIRSLLDGF